MANITNILFYVLLAVFVINLIVNTLIQEMLMHEHPGFWQQMGAPRALSWKSFFIIVWGRGMPESIKSQHHKSLLTARILFIVCFILFVIVMAAQSKTVF